MPKGAGDNLACRPKTTNQTINTSGASSATGNSMIGTVMNTGSAPAIVNNTTYISAPPRPARRGPASGGRAQPRSASGRRTSAPMDAHLLVVEEVEERQKAHQDPFLRMAVLRKGTQKVRDLYIYKSELRPELDILKSGHYAMFSKIMLGKGDCLTSTIDTEITTENVLAFKHNSKYVEEYTNPPIIPLEDVKDEPNGQRFSVEGKITKIRRGQICKTVELCALRGNAQTTVTLWRAMAEKALKNNDKVKIKALKKDKNWGICSTPSTVIEKL